jgi:hypothetical protein
MGRERSRVHQATLLIMSGTHSDSEVERVMAGARTAITKDIIDRARALPELSKIVLSTNSSVLASWAGSRGVLVEMDEPGPFHFGRTLRDVLRKHEAERVLYLGGGSAALMQRAQLRELVDTLCRAQGDVLITNNFYSTDFAAFSPASALERVRLPAIDNDLGWVLAEQAGLPNTSLQRCAATQLDVDTPTDLLTLAAHPGCGSHTRSYLDGLELDMAHIDRALALLVDRNAEVLVAGRVSSATWAYLETETACRVRVIAEERGMRASGRQARGEARSILGFYYQQVGARKFFRMLGSLGQAAFLDSRVIFAHLGVWPSPADRYNSDLRRPDLIQDPTTREFTDSAMSAPMPVVLGGHSLVSGGLYAIVEASWIRSGLNVPRYQDHTIWEHTPRPGPTMS